MASVARVTASKPRFSARDRSCTAAPPTSRGARDPQEGKRINVPHRARPFFTIKTEYEAHPAISDMAVARAAPEDNKTYAHPCQMAQLVEGGLVVNGGHAGWRVNSKMEETVFVLLLF